VGAPAALRRSVRSGWMPHLVMFTAMLIWSANATVVKFGLEHVRPASFMGARFLLGALGSWAVALAIHRRRALVVPRARVPAIAVVGIGINQLCFTFGLNLTTAVDASLIQGLTPILAGAMAMLIGRGRLPNTQIAALGLGLVGVSGVVLATPSQEGGSVIGDVINLGAPATYAFFLVFAAADAARLPATQITPWMLSGSLIVLLPVGIVDAVRSSEDWLGALPELLFAGLLSTTFAYTAGLWALPRLGATATAIYSYFQPPLGAAVGAAFLGEAYEPLQLGGTVLILVAAYLASSRTAPITVPRHGEDVERGEPPLPPHQRDVASRDSVAETGMSAAQSTDCCQ
jgi:drug/metabolite transporter (DMT)-like permease